MATRKRSTSKARAGTAGKRKTSSRIGTQSPKRKKQTSGRRTVTSSSRPARHRPEEPPSVIDADSDREIFGVQMSERRRKGEGKPSMPAAKTKTTQTSEPRSVPKTGTAKGRKRS